MMIKALQIITIILTGTAFLASLTVITKLRQPTSFYWWVVKIFAGALAPYFALAGLSGIFISLATGDLWIILPGIFSIATFSIYLRRIKKAMKEDTCLEQVYGADYENSINPAQRSGFISNPISLKLPVSAPFVLNQDISFCVIPGTERILRCDVWTPAKGAVRSGVAFIYFHGSAWSVLDKDFGTRPFFKHLVSQGHVIMDVAYRLFPETNMTGMVHDVIHAIAWMKAHAAEYGINPDRIVIGGASAGGHLAMLAAYNTAAFTPSEFMGLDLSVRAVISEYGPSDLLAMYYHTGQHITVPKQQNLQTVKPAPTPNWIRKMMGKNFDRLGMEKDPDAIGVLPVILGCFPDQHPEVYAAFSPITHVHQNCPPTLILQGEHDLISPVSAATKLYERLREDGVKTAMYIIPQTDHAFDLILPKISPVAHTAFYIIERFLAKQCRD